MPTLAQVTRDGSVAIVTLNRPQKKNALSVELRFDLIHALEDLQGDNSCRAIVLTGAGNAFCAGGDIKAMQPGDLAGSRYRLGLAQRIVRLLVAGVKPTVAAVAGPALGGGFALALACDKVIADPGATFAASYGNLGLMPDMALLWTLPQRVGTVKAKEIMMLSRSYKAPEAAALGIVDHVAADEPVLAAAVREAKALAEAAPLAVAMTKAAFARGVMDLEAVLALEADGQTLLYQTQDHAEGRDAFFAKRPPAFTGR
jgi:2-(1,2-epoxy-1,2-dihydrophenyl)acetyl-CoA isomerase